MAVSRDLRVLVAAAVWSGLTSSYQPFQGAIATRIVRSDDGSAPLQWHDVPVDEWLRTPTPPSSTTVARSKKAPKGGRAMLVFGTYAGDFNTFEYAQCLRYYWPQLRKAGGVNRCALVINGTPAAGRLVCQAIDLPPSIDVWVDNTGGLARRFNVFRGWLPELDNSGLYPAVKLLGMMPWGLGAPGTWDAIVGAYAGSPTESHPWVPDALAVGQIQGRWPDSILTLSDETRAVVHNKFDDFWWTGEWPLRPFEKATLRLQTLLGITLKHWDVVMPNAEAWRHGVLTQLGGCLVVDDGRPIYEWRDTGCCAIANFEHMIRALRQAT